MMPAGLKNLSYRYGCYFYYKPEKQAHQELDKPIQICYSDVGIDFVDIWTIGFFPKSTSESGTFFVKQK